MFLLMCEDKWIPKEMYKYTSPLINVSPNKKKLYVEDIIGVVFEIHTPTYRVAH